MCHERENLEIRASSMRRALSCHIGKPIATSLFRVSLWSANLSLRTLRPEKCRTSPSLGGKVEFRNFANGILCLSGTSARGF
jgi:hypothetical protein